MHIIFVRHGESYANTQKIISNRGLQHGLTPKGRAQALALAPKLQHFPVTRIYTSPILRAIETGILLAHQLGVDYQVDPALREFDAGSLEDRADKDAWQILESTFETWMKGEQKDQPLAGGESFVDVQDRFLPFIDRLVQQYNASQEALVCVGHGGIFWMMLPLVLSNVDTQFIADHGGFDHTTAVVSELQPGGLTCIQWL